MQKWQWHKLRNIWCGAHSNTGNPDGVPTVFKMVTFIQERMYCKENNANQIISIKGSYWSCFYVDKSFLKKKYTSSLFLKNTIMILTFWQLVPASRKGLWAISKTLLFFLYFVSNQQSWSLPVREKKQKKPQTDKKNPYKNCWLNQRPTSVPHKSEAQSSHVCLTTL